LISKGENMKVEEARKVREKLLKGDWVKLNDVVEADTILTIFSLLKKFCEVYNIPVSNKEIEDFIEKHLKL